MSTVNPSTAEQRRTLGWGARFDLIAPGLDIGCDLVLRADGTDLDLVSGVDLLAQDLRLALTTALGSSVFDTSFGFDGINAIATETDARLTRERVRIAVIRVLQREPRVRRVVDVAFVAPSTELSGETRVLEVRAVFEVAGGERLSLDIGKVPLT